MIKGNFVNLVKSLDRESDYTRDLPVFLHYGDSKQMLEPVSKLTQDD
jgi:hypothetical protein